MTLLGSLTIHFAQLLNSLLRVSPADPSVYWIKSRWIVQRAGSSHVFLVAMMAAHFLLGMFNLVLGQGLWRRRSWARQVELGVISLAGLLAAAHGVASLWVGRPWSDLGAFALLTCLPLVVTIVTFLELPGTAALFMEKTWDLQAVQGRRPWWMLSLQMFMGLMVIALALGILLVFNLGPMVEVAWVVIHLATGTPF